MLIRLFTGDYDERTLRHSRFVKFAEGALNLFPKIGAAGCSAKNVPVPGLLRDLLGGSAILKHLGGPLNAGLLAVLAATPFLPTMAAVLMVLAVFGMALFTNKFTLDLTAVPLLLFVAVTLFSGFFSLAPDSSIQIAILTAVIMLSYVLVRNVFSDSARVDFALGLFITSAAVTAFVAFYQIIIGYVNMTWVDRDIFEALSLRVYSTFANPNVYGTYLLLAIPIAAAMVFYVKRPLLKLYCAGVTVVLLLALLSTYSRGCYVALGLAAALFIVLIKRRAIILFIAALPVLPFVLPASVIQRVVSIVNFDDTSTAFRLNIWQGSIRILQDFWMAGLGQGPYAYNAVYPFYAFAATPAPHSHNLFLQIFLETGIVGLVLFIAILACFFRTQFSALRRFARAGDTRNKVLIAACIAAVAAFLVQSMFDHSFYNYRVMLTFFLVLGLANCLADGARQIKP